MCWAKTAASVPSVWRIWCRARLLPGWRASASTTRGNDLLLTWQQWSNTHTHTHKRDKHLRWESRSNWIHCVLLKYSKSRSPCCKIKHALDTPICVDGSNWWVNRFASCAVPKSTTNVKFYFMKMLIGKNSAFSDYYSQYGIQVLLIVLPVTIYMLLSLIDWTKLWGSGISKIPSK